MSKTPTSESAKEMRLIDHMAFKEIVGRYIDGTHQASERIERLRHALRHLKVGPEALASEERLNALKNGIRTVCILDLQYGDQRWCEYGFRHDNSDLRYSWGSTITILSLVYNLRFEERPHSTKSAWDINSALRNLFDHLEGVAELIDRLCHRASESGGDSSDAQLFTYAWAADILANVTLESSLKTLWVVRYPEGNPKTQLGHNYKQIWEELLHDHANVFEHATSLPIMFRCLALRETVESEINWAFCTMPEDEWVESNYWYTSVWDKDRVGMPYHKFFISLAAYCVAAKAATGRL